MNYHFDLKTNRRGNSMKWDDVDATFHGKDLLPLWIADMDFDPAPPIVEALKKRMEDPFFGYHAPTKEYYDAIISWLERHHHYHVEKEWLLPMSGVINAVGYSIRALSSEQDEVIVMPPVYTYLRQVILHNLRKPIDCPLKCNGSRYEIDFELLEQSVSVNTKLLLLCSPHNPVGRVWDLEELARLGDFCKRHNLYVVSDEIHNDIVFHKQHVVFSTVSEDAAQRSIICTAPTKTFSIAGVAMANVIIPNHRLREAFQEQLVKNNEWTLNTFASDMVIAACHGGEDWLAAVLLYIEENIEFFISYLRKNVPQLNVCSPEGTYFVWVDFSSLPLEEGEIGRFLIEDCKLGVNLGEEFGIGKKNFARFNLACSRKVLQEALRRLESGIALQLL